MEANIQLPVRKGADLEDVVATLVDLSRRGYLIIRDNGRDYYFERTEKPTDAMGLKSYEQTLIRLLSNAYLSSLEYQLAPQLPSVYEDINEELVHKNVFAENPPKARGVWVLMGFILAAGGGFGSFFLCTLLEDFIGAPFEKTWALVLSFIGTGVLLLIGKFVIIV
jgi:hypothetical protein